MPAFVSIRRRWLQLGAAAAMLWVAGATGALAVEPADLIRGVVSRSQAIVSGRLIYTFESQSFQGERALDPLQLPEVTTSFADSSWAERTKGSHVIRINHFGYFLEFVKTPQRDGSVRPGATLLPQRLLESRTELNVPPNFGGSFWFREQLLFAGQHADRFRLTDTRIVNDVPVTVLELAIPAAEHQAAFHVVVPALKSGGTLRLHVAPELGFVLPRIEFLTPSKQVAISYDAKNFSEVAPGIYFPRHLSTETRSEDGKPRFRGAFTTRCELINQPIPPEDFIVELPLGTRVQDAQQPGNVINFVLTEPSSSETLAVGRSDADWSFHFLERWRNAVIVGIVLGFITSFALFRAAKNQRHRVHNSKSPTRAVRQA